MKVSVVVPGYNCERTIKDCLEAILKQSYPVEEVIFVDDGSTDRSSQIVKEFDGKVKYFYQENKGPASARNYGANMAQGELIFFTDSDCIAENNWVEQSIESFNELEVGCVAGSYGIANDQSMLARCIYREILFRHTHLMPLYPKAFGSYNCAIRKAVFIESGGFNESYRHASGEDNDLSYRLLRNDIKIRFEITSKVAHFHPENLFKYLKEQFRHGFWRVRMYIDHPNMAGGDDYTYWKDIAEVPIVCLLSVTVLLSFYYIQLGWLVVAMIIVLLSMQCMVALKATKNNFERILLILATFLRGFARTFGFSSGIIYFLLNKSPKKVK